MPALHFVGTTSPIDPRELHIFHTNPRKGDVAAIKKSLNRHGQYKPVVANIGTFTGRANEVLAGNHTLMAIRELADDFPEEMLWKAVLVHWVDVDDDTANRIVIADNKIGSLGGMDSDMLTDMLRDFAGDIEGLGFTDADVTALLADGENDMVSEDSGADDFVDEGAAKGLFLPMSDYDVVAVKDALSQAADYYHVHTPSAALIAMLTEWTKAVNGE